MTSFLLPHISLTGQKTATQDATEVLMMVIAVISDQGQTHATLQVYTWEQVKKTPWWVATEEQAQAPNWDPQAGMEH